MENFAAYSLKRLGVEQIDIYRPARVDPAVPIEYSMISRGIEAGILPAARELGVGITAYGVLSRGLISGHWSRQRAGEADFRGQFSPRFQGDNLDANLALVERVRAIAGEMGVSIAQVVLSKADLARLEAAVPRDAVAGARYNDVQMAHLDSEFHA